MSEYLSSKLSSLHPVTSMQARIHEITSNTSNLRTIQVTKNEKDEDLLAEIGYKQELKRRFSTFQIFGIAFSIMSILPGIASLLGTALMAGPAGAVWSWAVASVFIFLIGVAMSELASAIPTSGGLYYWTFYYAPDAWRVPLSFLIGISNTMALCSGVVSVFYGTSEEILAAVYLTKNGDFDITTGKTYGVFAACVIAGAIATCLSSKNVAMLQSVSSVCQVGILVLFFIALPIGTKINRGEFNGRGFIFGEVQNYSDWPIGWEFCLSFMTAVWTIGAFDSCVHMSEEAKNATYGVPIGICSSVAVCCLLGLFILICTVACMDPNVDAVLSTDSGFPMAQVIYDSLGRRWAIAFMALMAGCLWFCGSSLVTAASRQIWAFARDDGLPFCSIVKVVNKKLKVPIRAIIMCCLIALSLGCLCLAGTAAANALFSLGVLGNYVSWCTPIFLRLTFGKHRFNPGSFYLGPTLSSIVGWTACAWGAFIVVLVCFPATKTVTKENMNYCIVITGGVWILSAVLFFTYKYKYYHGPRSNLENVDPDVISSTEELSYQHKSKV